MQKVHTPLLSFIEDKNADFLLFQRYSTNVNYNSFLFFDYYGFPYVGVSIVLEGELSYKSDKGRNTG